MSSRNAQVLSAVASFLDALEEATDETLSQYLITVLSDTEASCTDAAELQEVVAGFSAVFDQLSGFEQQDLVFRLVKQVSSAAVVPHNFASLQQLKCSCRLSRSQVLPVMADMQVMILQQAQVCTIPTHSRPLKQGAPMQNTLCIKLAISSSSSTTCKLKTCAAHMADKHCVLQQHGES